MDGICVATILTLDSPEQLEQLSVERISPTMTKLPQHGDPRCTAMNPIETLPPLGGLLCRIW